MVASLDDVCLTDVFENRARVMRSVPFVMRGAFRTALRVAFVEIEQGVAVQSEIRGRQGMEVVVLVAQDVVISSCTRRIGFPQEVGGTSEKVPSWTLDFAAG